MEQENCPMCGGDGRIELSHRASTCPACRGRGKRSDDVGFHDVTKTKPEHHHPAAKAKAEKQTGPSTFEGRQLVEEVKASHLPDSDKARLTQSIIEYEAGKGSLTKTFTRLIRKQIRVPS